MPALQADEKILIPMQAAPVLEFWRTNDTTPTEQIFVEANEGLFARAETADPNNVTACFEINDKTSGDNDQGWCDSANNWISPSDLPGIWQQDSGGWNGSFEPAGTVLSEQGYRFWFKDMQSGTESNPVIVTVLHDQGQTTSCAKMTESTPVPSGFGSAYDMFTPNNPLLVNLLCKVSSVQVLIGNASPFHYIYDTGYVWDEDSWTPFSLDCDMEKIDHSWCVGSATAQVNNVDMTEENYLIAYTCQWVDDQWKCGCRDETCTDMYWQLQVFQGVQ